MAEMTVGHSSSMCELEYEEAYAAVEYVLMELEQNCWIWGEPGCGKTRMADRLEARMKQGVWPDDPFLCRIPPLVSQDTADLRGIPSLADKPEDQRQCTVWNIADYLPLNPLANVVVFGDEAAQGKQDTQGMYLQVTGPPFSLGGTMMPERMRWFFASNRKEDRAGTNPIITPLLNRFTHIDLAPNAKAVANYLRRRGIPGCTIVADYLDFRPENVSSFKPNQPQRAFASGRVWEDCCAVVANPPPSDNIFRAVLCGKLGIGVGSDFCGFVEIQKDLPTLGALLSDPDNVPVPDHTQPAVAFAICKLLVDHGIKNPQDLPTIFTLALRMPSDYCIKLTGEILGLDPQLRKLPQFITFQKRHGALYSS